MKRASCVFSVLLLILPCIGCGGTDGKLKVSGTVTLKGEPLDDGIIEFSSPEIRTGANITQGKYEVPPENGLKPGTYSVSITAGDGRTPAESPDGLPGPSGANIISKDRIPPEYNVKSTQQITVEAGKENVFDYAIP